MLINTRITAKPSFALNRFFKIRHRHVLTKNNKVRLRYCVGAASALSMALVMAVGMPASSGLSFSGSDFMRTSIHQKQAEQRLEQRTQIEAFTDEVGGVLQGHISEGIRKASIVIQKAPKAPPPLDVALKIGRGDTLAGILQREGLSGKEAYHTVKALSTHFDPRKIRPGQELDVRFKRGSKAEERLYHQASISISPVKDVIVTKNGDTDFSANIVEKELIPNTYGRAAQIETSLYGSALKAGIPAPVIANVIRTYSWDVDFQRDIRRGDKIEVLYEARETKDGDHAEYGNILYANLSVGGKDIPIYRYKMKNGRTDYFEPNGYSIRKTLMKTPIDGARISSGFGLRKHPVLGYKKAHKGVDFAAPTGTPIYAAGDGVVEFKGRKGGYGNYIKLRHNSRLHTAYAHMNKFAKGIGNGKRVEQGDVIGYVGTTGRSTGPHLHYEVLVNGVQKNPKSVDLPTGEELTGQELKNFKALVASLDKKYKTLAKKSLKFAHKNEDHKSVYFLR